jgi:hypothetical protein
MNVTKSRLSQTPPGDNSASSVEPSDNGTPASPHLAPEPDIIINPTEIERTSNQPPAGPDPFDPAALRLTADQNASLGVKKVWLTVPVRRPQNSWFVRVHPDESFRLQTAVIELKEDREFYLVSPTLRPDLATEVTLKLKILATAVNRQGALFIWEANLPRTDGRADVWSRTALEAVDLATRGWVRVVANMGAGGYDVFQASAQLADPEWPNLPFREILRVAFKDRFIDSLDHPVLRKLRGEE